MEAQAQFNFQVKSRKDTREWENIEVHYRTYCNRNTAIRYARRISKIFKSEIRLTQGVNPFRANGTYIRE